MANFTIDPNVGFLNPIPGIDGGIGTAPAGQDYASLVSNALTALAAVGHTGTPNDGKKIVTAAININGDLSFNSFNATNLNTTRYINQSGTIVSASDINELYVVSGNLYFNNASGTPVQVTSGASVNAPMAGASTIWAYLGITSNHTILSSDPYSYYGVGTNSAAVTVNLPPANSVAAGLYYFFKDTSGNAGNNNITITPNGTDNIDGANASVFINWGKGSALLVSNGIGGWFLQKNIVNNLQGNPIDQTAATAGQFLIEKSSAAGNGWFSLSGDVTNSTTPGAITVTGLQGNSFTSGSPTKGQFVMATSTSNYGPVSVSGDISESASTAGALTVTGLQGNTFTSGAPTKGQFVVATSTSNYGPVTLSGDITESSSTAGLLNVVNIHGASVPSAGGLTTGNVLQVTGSSALGYAPLNLAGGANFVTGSLPSANQAAQTLSGDVTGSTSSTTVTHIQGNTFTSGSPTKGQFVLATSTSNYGPVTISGDITDSATTAGALTVAKIQGVTISGTPSNGQVLTASSSSAASWSSVAASFSAGNDLSGTATSQNVISATGASGTFAINCASVANYPLTGNQGTLTTLTNAQTTDGTTTVNTIVIVIPSVSSGRVDITISARTSSGNNCLNQTWSGKVYHNGATLNVYKSFAPNDAFDTSGSLSGATINTPTLTGSGIQVGVVGVSSTTVNWTFAASYVSTN